MLSQRNAIETSLDVTPANAQDRLNHTVITPLLDQHLNKTSITKQNINRLEMMHEQATRCVHNVYNSA